MPDRLWRGAPPTGEGSGMPPRVLLGTLEPVVSLGMSAVLAEEGIDVIGSEPRPGPLVLLAGRLRPDAVVLDLHTARQLADRVREAAPETTLVLWARDEDVMEVVDPGAAEPRRVLAPNPGELRSELMRSQVNRVER
jgi:DNA-binding NarL/FixJ family response regulator